MRYLLHILIFLVLLSGCATKVENNIYAPFCSIKVQVDESFKYLGCVDSYLPTVCPECSSGCGKGNIKMTSYLFVKEHSNRPYEIILIEKAQFVGYNYWIPLNGNREDIYDKSYQSEYYTVTNPQNKFVKYYCDFLEKNGYPITGAIDMETVTYSRLFGDKIRYRLTYSIYSNMIPEQYVNTKETYLREQFLRYVTIEH